VIKNDSFKYLLFHNNLSDKMTKKEEKEIIYSIQNEEQLDEFKKPKVAFYSNKKIIQSLLALPEVKEGIKSLLKEGKKVDIERYNSGFFDLNIHGKEDDEHGWREMGISAKDSKGVKILKTGIREADFSSNGWLALGYGIGATIGHFDASFANQTYAQIQQAAYRTGAEGAGIGGAVGTLADAVIVGRDLIKTYVAPKLKRVRFANRIRKTVNEGKV